MEFRVFYLSSYFFKEGWDVVFFVFGLFRFRFFIVFFMGVRVRVWIGDRVFFCFFF